jgi:transposase
MGRMTLITGDERRRRWSDEDRVRILAAVEAPGAVVAEVARREDICTSLVYRWRRDARAAMSTAGFAEVMVEHAPQPSLANVATMSEPECSAILVEMKNARVRIGGNASSALIAATLQALRS